MPEIIGVNGREGILGCWIEMYEYMGGRKAFLGLDDKDWWMLFLGLDEGLKVGWFSYLDLYED